MPRTTYEAVAISDTPTPIVGTLYPSTFAQLGDVQTVNDAGELTAQITVHAEPTGTSPTMTAKLQDSLDGNNFVDLPGMTVTFTGSPQASTLAIRCPGPGTSDAKTFGKFVRCVIGTGGTTPSYPAVSVYFYKKE